MRFFGPILGVCLWALPLMAADLHSGSPVYPAKQGQVRFSHLAHEHAACESCHPSAADRQRSLPSDLGGHGICAGCHPNADEDKGFQENCQQCHPPRFGAPRRLARGAAFLKFSHRLHADAPESCMTCHLPEHEDGADGLLPQASQCAACHGEMMRDRCDACHPTGSDGRMKLVLDGVQLLPRGGHGGDDHRSGWLNRHGAASRRRKEQCDRCHTARSCDTCHRGNQLAVRIHPADWELSHPGPARAGLMDCDRCHRSQSMCLSCHRKAGVSETSEKRSANMRLHPEGYKGLHSADARRNLKSCTACHTEGDCIACHGAPGIGLGVSPHPPGFRGRCGLLKGRNSRPCLKCHPPTDLEARCP